MRAYATELVGVAPDVILAQTTPVTAALLRETRKIPIVFVIVSYLVGSGFVETLSHPGGNVTGFVNLESSLVEKWVELLREVAPQVTRAAMMFNPETAPYAGYYMRPFEAAARSFGIEPIGAPVRDDAEIQRVIARLGRADPKGGLIVMTDIYTTTRREPIIRLTAVMAYPQSTLPRLPPATADWHYGVDTLDQFRRAAGYVDRILKGEKPADLPVQAPTKYELVINLKTAKALGIDVPPTLLARADEVIE